MSDHSRIAQEMKELKGKVTDEELLDLFLVIAGEKPGALIMDPDRRDFKVIKKLIEREDLAYRIFGDERGLLSRIFGREKRFTSRGVFVSEDEERFHILEESDGDFYGCNSESVGEFLGYPDSAIEHYLTVRVPGKETIEEVKENFPRKELEYLALLSYIPRPEEEAIDEAIDEGKRRFRIVKDSDAEFMEDLAGKLMEKSVWN